MQNLNTRSSPNNHTEGRRFPVVLGVLSGIVGALAFPDFHIWPLAFVAYIPMLLAIRNQKAGKRFITGLATGFILHLIVYHWVRHTMISMSDLSPSIATIVLIAFALASGLLQGFFALFAEPIRQRTPSTYWFFIPTIYVLLEYAFPHLFSWYLGNAVYRQITLIQISDLTGVYGISFAIMTTNCLLAQATQHLFDRQSTRQIWSPIVVSVILWTLIISYGTVRRHQLEQLPHTNQLRIAAVQPYVTPEDKKKRGKERKIILEKALTTTQTLPQQSFDVVIWPEGSFPYHYPGDSFDKRIMPPTTLADESAKAVSELARKHATHWIFGTLRESGDGTKTHNSLIHLDDSGKLIDVYDKRKLVAFGEYMPLSDTFPQLKNAIGGVSDMSPGRSPGIFEINGVRILPSICYEAIFPNFTRVSANYAQGADMIVNLTNDVWFGPHSAPELHLMVQTHRAAELRLPLVRVTNSGISAFVAPTGEITDQTQIFEATVLTGVVPVQQIFSFYRWAGDVFVYVLAVLGVIAAVGWSRRENR